MQAIYYEFYSLYYLRVQGAVERSPSLDSPSSSLDTHRTNANPDKQPLDTCYDLICDNYSFQVPLIDICPTLS